MYFTASNFFTGRSSKGLLSSETSESSLLSNNEENTSSLLSIQDNNSGFDAFGGKDIFGNINLSNMNETFFACAQGAETAGSVAYNSAETIGSIAFNSAETSGSVACAGGSISCGSGEGGSSFSSFC